MISTKVFTIICSNLYCMAILDLNRLWYYLCCTSEDFGCWVKSQVHLKVRDWMAVQSINPLHCIVAMGSLCTFKRYINKLSLVSSTLKLTQSIVVSKIMKLSEIESK